MAMRYKELHPWDVDYKEAVALQERLRRRVIIRRLTRGPRVIAGADVAYSKLTDSIYAGVVMMDYKDMTRLEEVTATGRSPFPYIPGLLSFREAPVLLKAFSMARQEPDVILFDGQGIAHPRGLGLASHLGLILDRPAIGCAKGLLVGQYKPVGLKAGAHSYIVYNKKRVGSVLRTKSRVRPVFVSPGHRIDLATSLRVVLQSCRGYRLPEPIRQAHRLVGLLRRKEEKGAMGA